MNASYRENAHLVANEINNIQLLVPTSWCIQSEWQPSKYSVQYESSDHFTISC